MIAQAVSALLCLIRLMKMKELFDLKLCYMKLKKKSTRKIIRLGLPSGVTQAIFSMAMIVVQSLTNSFGEMFIAANVIVMRVDGFAMMPNFSFGTAMTTYAGQNVGAKQGDRVDQGAKQGTLIAVEVSAVFAFCVWQGAYGNFYRDAGAGGIEPEHDGDSCSWLYCYGGNPESFRCDAWSR